MPSTSTAPRCGPAEAEERAHEGALARSRSPHEGDELAGSDAEVDAVEGRNAHRGITHGHVPEPDLTGRPLRDDGPAGSVIDGLVEERLDPAERVAGALQIGPDP